MNLWRIAAETRRYAAIDLSGKGAALRPGRWNDDGQLVVYTALTPALAVLETVAHIDDAGLPLNRFLVRIQVAEPVWRQREELHVDELPTSWSAIPAGRASVEIGSKWLAAGASPILLVPSVIVPEERVALVPAHPSARSIVAQAVRRFVIEAEGGAGHG